MRVESTAWLVVAVLIGACTSGGSENAAPASTPTARSRGPVLDIDIVPSPAATITEPIGDWFESSCSLEFEYLRRIRRGYKPGRSADVVVVPREPNAFGGAITPAHSGPYDYMQRVPLVFYGPGFIRSQGDISLGHESTLADLAPTLAELLKTPFPKDRAGKPITEVLLPEAERAASVPKLIMTIVWDGGGLNVLHTWPDAWPHLAKIMAEGTSVTDVISGSSPSVTPAIHATIGTGTFPKQHGIVDIPVRDGDRTYGSYRGRTPQYLDVTTLADLYDQATGNRALVGLLAYKSWHFGMMGHGAYIDGGDKDIAVLADLSGKLSSNKSWYTLPAYLDDVPGFNRDIRTVDVEDGKADRRWLGHDMLQDPSELRHTPVWVLYQTSLLKSLIDHEGYGDDEVTDLLFTNFKQVDEVGHDWNMVNPEMENVIRYTDDALGDLIEYLDKAVGKDQWVIAMTADHGQAPAPEAYGSWPVRMTELTNDIATHFGVSYEELFQDQRPLALWLDADTMAAHGITEEDIAEYLIDYRLEENIPAGGHIGDQWESRRREPIFAAAFPGSALPRIWHCAKERR